MLVQIGQAGNEVVVVQKALQAAGYTGLVADGIFGPLTQQAVMNFQQADGWPVTGVVDDALYGRMQEIAGMLIVSAAQAGAPIYQIEPWYRPNNVYGPFQPDPLTSHITNGGAVPITGGLPTLTSQPSPVTPGGILSAPMLIGVALLAVTLYVVAGKHAHA